MLDSVLRGVYSAIAPAGAHARLSTLIFHRVLVDAGSAAAERTQLRRNSKHECAGCSDIST